MLLATVAAAPSLLRLLDFEIDPVVLLPPAGVTWYSRQIDAGPDPAAVVEYARRVDFRITYDDAVAAFRVQAAGRTR